MIWLIARRELATRGRSRGFAVITSIMFVVVLLGAVAAAFLTGGDDERREVTIGVSTDDAVYVDALAVGSESLSPIVGVTDDGRAALARGGIDVYLEGDALVWDGFPDTELDTYVRGAVQAVEVERRLGELQLDAGALGRVLAPVDLTEERLDGDDDEFGVRLLAAGVAGLGTFLLLQIWGAFIMMGVIEEKSSRVVEVLLSHVRPRTLLTGKVLGLGLLALFQMAIFVGGLVLALALLQDIEVPDGVWGTVPLLLVTFLLSFAFYGTAFAAVGAMVSRQEDAQTAQLPVMLPLLIGYMIAVSSITSADNVAVRVGSYLPFTSPVLLPFRNAFENLPWWEVALSLGILAVSTLVMLRFGSWLYRYSLLRTGSRVRWSQAWRDRGAIELG